MCPNSLHLISWGLFGWKRRWCALSLTVLIWDVIHHLGHGLFCEKRWLRCTEPVDFILVVGFSLAKTDDGALSLSVLIFDSLHHLGCGFCCGKKGDNGVLSLFVLTWHGLYLVDCGFWSEMSLHLGSDQANSWFAFALGYYQRKCIFIIFCLCS